MLFTALGMDTGKASVGERILRSETAAVSALAVLKELRGDWC
jgi:16S rRNA U1498 N3-methylase RsmE